MTDHPHLPAHAAPSPLPAHETPAPEAPTQSAAPPADPDDLYGPGHPAAAFDPCGFAPVPVAARHDGWTAPRQRRFIVALATSGCVREAARAVGMSPETAYRLRRRPDAQAFRLAWDAALDFAMGRLADALTSRAINGVEIPHYWRGELVGTHRRHDNRLGQWLLRTRAPARFAPQGRHVEAGETDASAQRLDLLLYALERETNLHAPWYTSRRGKDAKALCADLDRLDKELAAFDAEGHASPGDAA